MPQLEQIEAIEKRLWKAVDTLRANSNYASNEYFLPVMGLVFLRHAYSRFLAVKESIVSGLPTRGGRARPLAKEDFSQRGAIFLQPKAKGRHLALSLTARTGPKPSSRRWSPLRRIREPARRSAQERVSGAG